MKKTKKKKKVAKKQIKKAAPKTVRHEIVVRAVGESLPKPTETDLAEPMRDGKKLTIPETWIKSAQLIRLTEKTPRTQVYRRKGKGGQIWDYVTVSYIQRLLDYVFGWNWDFEIVEHGKELDHVWVLGRLTVRSADGKHQIVKTQFGRSEVKYTREEKKMLDYGNDLKSAASDALKKCASMLGIARDIYGKTEYREESGNQPKPTPEVSRETTPESEEETETTQSSLSTDKCRGVKGTGCPYGNDAEPLSEEVAKYSKRVYHKPLCRECQKDAKK